MDVSIFFEHGSQHPTDLGQQRFKLWRKTLDIPQIDSDLQLGHCLIERSSRNGKKMSIICIRSPTIAFCDIGRNGHHGTSKLIRQCISLISRKSLRQGINRLDQLHGLLPNDQIFKKSAVHLHLSPSPHVFSGSPDRTSKGCIRRRRRSRRSPPCAAPRPATSDASS